PHEVLAALEIGFGEGESGTGLRQLGLGLGEGGLEGTPVDAEQQVALVDELAIPEVNGVEITRDAGPHLDGVDGDEAADIFVPLGQHLTGGLGHGHLWGRRGRALSALLVLLAAGKAGGEQEKHECGEAELPARYGCWHGYPGVLTLHLAAIWA